MTANLALIHNHHSTLHSQILITWGTRQLVVFLLHSKNSGVKSNTLGVNRGPLQVGVKLLSPLGLF